MHGIIFHATNPVHIVCKYFPHALTGAGGGFMLVLGKYK